MRTKLLIPAAAAVLLSSFAAFAANDTMTTGIIKALDMKAHTITLDNGVTYNLPANFVDPGLKVGAKVTVGWQIVGGKNDADSVKIDK